MRRDTELVVIIARAWPVQPTPSKRWHLGSERRVASVAIVGTVIWFLRGIPRTSSARSEEGSRSRHPLPSCPFRISAPTRKTDFLRMALPDEVATTLSAARTLSIRPFATTGKYANADVDVQKAGAEHARGPNRHRTLSRKFATASNSPCEAIDVSDDHVLWQETMNLSRGRSGGHARAGDFAACGKHLIPALGASSGLGRTARSPTNEEAYDLYLRSVALAHDGEPNREAVRMLERCHRDLIRQLRPDMVCAWASVITTKKNMRPGATGTMLRTEPTLRHVRSLFDPNLADAAQQIVSLDTDAGRLAQAYQRSQGDGR